jgi:hypothetical protein
MIFVDLQINYNQYEIWVCLYTSIKRTGIFMNPQINLGHTEAELAIKVIKEELLKRNKMASVAVVDANRHSGNEQGIHCRP